MEEIIIREFSEDHDTAINEINQCIDLQIEVGWFPDIVTPHIFRADTINLVDKDINLGYVLIAVDSNNKITGFLRVTPTTEPSKHWAHELVVSRKIQSKNIGFSLFDAARNKSKTLGASSIYFTYDAMEGPNGNLYLKKMGANAVKIYENLYGNINSEAHGNRKTHRFLIHWNLQNDNSKDLSKEEFDYLPSLDTLIQQKNEKKFKIEIPYAVQSLNTQDAKDCQDKIFELLIEYINKRGYIATYLYTDPELKKNYLILEKNA